MNEEKAVVFKSTDAEVEYWKLRVEDVKDCLHKLQQESEEYVFESQQLEKELEATIDQNEQKIKELTLVTNKIQIELDMQKNKVEQLGRDNNNLEQKVSTLSEENLLLHEHIRELEQKNDNLETCKRIMEESINDIKVSFDNALEKNAILELEVDEKETMKEKLQRLIDERRELQQELLVKGKLPMLEKRRKYKNPAPQPPKKTLEAECQTTPTKNKKIRFKAFRAFSSLCSKNQKRTN
ncbi:unnamed protein product [Brassicogethes aeneus]|uniref:NUDE domain-containing protein n=1 Tax=Brassicogethes aeneus TaxID=1431903 RepID=A0A9P0BEN0_BRAAE|nr:unnamed protein product [Brassicogethes aeneus]